MDISNCTLTTGNVDNTDLIGNTNCDVNLNSVNIEVVYEEELNQESFHSTDTNYVNNDAISETNTHFQKTGDEMVSDDDDIHAEDATEIEGMVSYERK